MKKILRIIIRCFYQLINFINLKKQKVSYGKNLNIYGLLKLYGPKNRISFGDNVTLRSEIKTNPLGGMDELRLAISEKGRIIIGNNVGISNSCIRSFEYIQIDDDVYIGGDCKIYDTDFHSVVYSDRIIKNDYNKKTDPVHIKKGAFIGAHSIILKGVTVGEYSVIGAGSVVTKNIPDNEVWAGNPARFIKKIKDE